MQTKEKGNVIDQIGSILVMAFIFVMLLAFAAYGRMTQVRLEYNNIAKEYLYLMEQNGYLRAEDKTLLVDDFANAKANVVIEPDTTEVQQTYGDKVTLHLTVTFQNPLYTVFSTDGAMFNIFGFNPDLVYEIKKTTTTKW